MTTYNINVLICPSCEMHFNYLACRTCNSFGAVRYTDGVINGPMYVNAKKLTQCPRCNSIHWIDELKIIEIIDENDFFPKYMDNEHNMAKHVDEKGFYSLIKSSFWRNRDDELFIRIGAWRYQTFSLIHRTIYKLNGDNNLDTNNKPRNIDPFRYEEPVDPEAEDNREKLLAIYDDNDEFQRELKEIFLFKLEVKDNRKNLLAMLDDNDEYQRILKAELYRQVGSFDKAIQLLDYKPVSSGYMTWVNTIIKYAREMDTEVQVVPDSTD